MHNINSYKKKCYCIGLDLVKGQWLSMHTNQALGGGGHLLLVVLFSCEGVSKLIFSIGDGPL
jgi:hypothetical protein